MDKKTRHNRKLNTGPWLKDYHVYIFVKDRTESSRRKRKETKREWASLGLIRVLEFLEN